MHRLSRRVAGRRGSAGLAGYLPALPGAVPGHRGGLGRRAGGVTVDWTPATRIKGVLILVGLSYFAGLSLYFLKKEMVDRVKDFFDSSRDWHTFHPPNSNYSVRLPANLANNTKPSPDQPL